MERRELGLTGIHLPVIGVGARGTFDVFGKESQSARRSLVDDALGEGANFFETSPDAGEADGILGSSLTGRRHRAIVATSLKPGDSRRFHAQIDRALRLFDEQIDILMVEGVSAWEEFEPVFRQMKSDRTVRAFGISCLDTSEFPALVALVQDHRLDVVQIPYNPAMPEAANSILPAAAAAGAGVIVGQPFVGGELLDIEVPGQMLSSLRRYRANTSPAAILKWIISDPRVCSVVVGTRRQRHLMENLAAGDPPWMDPASRKGLTTYFRSMHPRHRYG